MEKLKSKTRNGLFFALIFALSMALPMFFGAQEADAAVIYVDASAVPGGDGTSWADAYIHLQDALAEAGSGDEIWVAAGTYYPDEDTNNPDGTGDREASFRMIKGVSILGGFAGHETSLEERVLSDATETFLSGDIGTEGDDSDNCYHVFYHPFHTNLDDTAILDGFTITDGNADGSWPHDYGGGMHSTDFNSSPTLTNCTFYGNTASYGGGMYNAYSTSPVLNNCTFYGNTASYGGGMYNSYSSPTLTNCIFYGNTAGFGGGMYNYASSPVLTNCTFYGNTARFGGGISDAESSSSMLTNCILWGDTAGNGSEIYNTSDSFPEVAYCAIQGGFDGEGNIDEDPLFADSANGDFHLDPDSPCIDAGTNDAPNLPATDCDGEVRIFDGDDDGVATVDMGVDEYFYADTLSLSANGYGTTIPRPGVHNYNAGTQVEITAIPLGRNAVFKLWKGTGVPVSQRKANPLTITMDSDKNIRAFFVRRYSLTIAVGGDGNGGTTRSAPGTYTYNEGQMIRIRALPDPGYVFSYWEGVSERPITQNPIRVTIDSDRRKITAYFRRAIKKSVKALKTKRRR
ncbi:MAG: right-handed parallel beta-helix repeat-containing protein [Deltaproteobacteria bacterium]|nr:right-handed parallel beta-helix repeat-containing protein [Deltaproteobacteria bacterium]